MSLSDKDLELAKKHCYIYENSYRHNNHLIKFRLQGLAAMLAERDDQQVTHPPKNDDRYMEGFNAGKNFAELETDDRVRELEKDAARWRYFIETCSSEMGYAICGHEDASNEEINKAIDQAMKEANQ